MLQTKDALFECLAAQDGFISGELLAERLGVSRSAVWKAVGELRAEGCRIEAAQNRGYALRDPGSRLSAGRIQALLRGRAADCRVLVERAVDSTNDELKRRAAAGCPTGTVLVAERQTGGKGRLGRSFYSPPRGGLYMSLLLRPGAAGERMHGRHRLHRRRRGRGRRADLRPARRDQVGQRHYDGREKALRYSHRGGAVGGDGAVRLSCRRHRRQRRIGGLSRGTAGSGDVDVRRRRESAARPGGGGDSQSAVREVRDASAADVYGRIPRAELRHRAGNHDDGFFPPAANRSRPARSTSTTTAGWLWRRRPACARCIRERSRCA